MWIVGVCLAVPLLGLLALKLYISSGKRCGLMAKLEGKVVIITGANGGLGRATALLLARKGGHIIIACRNKVKGEATVAYIRRKSGSDLVNFLPLDLSSMKSVSEFVDMFVKQYVSAYSLINNAAYMGPKQTTADGFDLCYQTNYLAHFYLTQLLITRSKPDKTRPLRVINVSSDSYRSAQIDFDDLMYKTKYDIYNVYGATKLALMWLTIELNYRYSGTGISSVAVHPGAVYTGLLRNWPGIKGDVLRLAAKLLFRTPETGAQSLAFSVLVDYLEDFTGRLIYDCAGTAIEPIGKDYKQAEKLYNISWDMCSLGDPKRV